MAGNAYLRTAAQLARESDHAELAAWCTETVAWQLLTAGEYRQAAELSRAAQETAPASSSALIQATAQEGRAFALLGDGQGARAALAAVERLVSPLPPPEHPEHHYVYDPPKARVYIATTLAWLGDRAAEPAAREILAALDGPRHRPAPGRAGIALTPGLTSPRRSPGRAISMRRPRRRCRPSRPATWRPSIARASVRSPPP